jgi:hypothetical protein
MDQNFQLSPVDPMDCYIKFSFLNMLRENTSISIKLREVTGKASSATLVI